MKCYECGREFAPECSEEEICPECQVVDVPEAHMETAESDYFDEGDWRYDEPEDEE
jgi:hypothetical protein